MLSVSFLALVMSAVQPVWHSDYDKACEKAKAQGKDIVVYFREDGDEGALDGVFEDSEVREQLSQYVCLKLPVSYEYEGKRLIDYDAFVDMVGSPGLAVISYHDKNQPFYRELVSAHPLVGSHYAWVPRYGVREVQAILDLPADATLTQRSMIYAVTVHPERPRSIHGEGHWAFMDHARRHSERQASMRNQHHANIIGTSNWLQSVAGIGMGNASEVVAESWGRVVGGENVLEASFSCVDAWRHSPGHWGAVSRAHRYFGYDIAKGANGTWYATGIFAD